MHFSSLYMIKWPASSSFSLKHSSGYHNSSLCRVAFCEERRPRQSKTGRGAERSPVCRSIFLRRSHPVAALFSVSFSLRIHVFFPLEMRDVSVISMRPCRRTRGWTVAFRSPWPANPALPPTLICGWQEPGGPGHGRWWAGGPGLPIILSFWRCVAATVLETQDKR